MLEDFFTHGHIIARHRAGLFGTHVDGLTEDLSTVSGNRGPRLRANGTDLRFRSHTMPHVAPRGRGLIVALPTADRAAWGTPEGHVGRRVAA